MRLVGSEAGTSDDHDVGLMGQAVVRRVQPYVRRNCTTLMAEACRIEFRLLFPMSQTSHPRLDCDEQ